MTEFEMGDFDFGKMLDEGIDSLKDGFTPGEKVTGIVVDITSNSVLLDINMKSEGIIERSQLEENGELNLGVGDSVEAYFVGMTNGEIILTTKMKRGDDVNDAELQNAFECGIPVEGKVSGSNNAGLEVAIGGMRGFCPASMVDTFHVEELSAYVGQVLTFQILEFGGGNLVVSRRMHLEKLREEKSKDLEQRLAVGDIITGTVTRIADFGAFVDIGGVDGLVPMGEIAWERVKDAAEYVTVGEKITIKVLKLDWDAKRFTLSIKQAGSDPWETLEDEFRSGIPYTGTVTRLMNFGAFVQLKPGVEGLVHISKLGGGRRLAHPREVVDEGQEIEVFVESIDLEQHRISLAIEQTRSSSDEGDAIVTIGKEVKGTVEEIRQYGAFIRLEDGKRGLLHVSELGDDLGPNRSAELRKQFPMNEEVTVIIKEVRDGKISLTTPAAKDGGANVGKMMAEQKKESEGFGSLGGLFDGL